MKTSFIYNVNIKLYINDVEYTTLTPIKQGLTITGFLMEQGAVFHSGSKIRISAYLSSAYDITGIISIKLIVNDIDNNGHIISENYIQNPTDDLNREDARFVSSTTRPVGRYTLRNVDMLPNVGTAIYVGYTILNTSDGKYYIAESVNGKNVNWVEESVFTGKDIPTDVARRGTTEEQPADEYVINHLYEGFEYYDTTLDVQLFVSSISDSVIWELREYPSEALVANYDISAKYFDIGLNRNIYVGDININTGDIHWVCDDAFSAVPRKGGASKRPTGLRNPDGTGTLWDSDWGMRYYDNTLFKEIIVKKILSDGSIEWVDTTGATV